MRITLRQLQVFRTVCEQLSYSRTADLLGLTQPAVSQQIRLLEELVEEPLFEYIGKKLYLTDAAEHLFRTTNDIFQRLDELDMQLSELRGTLKGNLRIAAESSAKYLLPHILASFQQRHPDIHSTLNVFNRSQLLKRMNENRDDLVIMTNVPEELSLEFMPFLKNPIIAVANPRHPLAEQPGPLSLDALPAYTLLSRENGSGTRKACEEFFQQKRIHFNHIMEFNSHEAQREGVIAGLGIAFVPRHCVYRELQDGSIIELPIKAMPLLRSWCLVHPRGKKLSPVAQALEDFIREERQVIRAIAEKFGVNRP
ncbi:LysR family transcriptional regulator [Shewanella yunxiaonensis]|uniref:LysR family transcriptional regulator n=2 Tax=Shewanellaceae TaxID=267890 RepID=A0ABX7YZF9_9GAMM|nr:LysR family transcriptional regulator [Shewanella yunxiaonensis]